MSFIQEDGTGLSNATSYGSISGGDTYFVSRGSSVEWQDASDTEKQGAMMYSTEFLDSNFNWKSSILKTTQSLGIPRVAYYDSEGRLIEGVPLKIEYGCYELALEHLKGNLRSTDLEGISSESVGSASVTYSGSGAKSFSAVKLNLREFGASSKSSVSEVFRA